jgi:DNA-binding NtrC family response regulator
MKTGVCAREPTRHPVFTQVMPLFDTTIWIVHRESGPRSALARMTGGVGGRHEIVLGAPMDKIFESAAAPHVVVLDVSTAAYDPEPELDFARRVQARTPGCAWILVAEPASIPAAEQLFDTLASRPIPYPPDARSLANALSAALAGLRPLPLSRRIARDRVAARFARWFGRDEPANLHVALDPRLAGEPLCVSGETGTGRGLLLRYVHQVTAPGAAPFVRVACNETTRPNELLAQIEDGAGEEGRAPSARFTIWLEGLDRLPARTQSRLLDWIEFGLPLVLPAPVRAGVRWMASTAPDTSPLDPRLALAFAELEIRTTPLRAQPDLVAPFVADTARAWASARRQPPPDFDPPALDLLRGEPWPGNLGELEALVVRSLAHAAAETRTLRIADLRFDPKRPGGASIELFDRADGADRAETVERVEPSSGPSGDPTPEAPAVAETGQPDPDATRRLASAVAHEVRNPLVSIRTFSDLLEEHYDDPEFRERFGRVVADDVRRIEDVVDRLERMGDEPDAGPGGAVSDIDVTELLEALLVEHRPRIQAKRLLVLKELDRARPVASANEAVLRDALGGLLAHAIEEIPERGDLYLASRHHTVGQPSPTMRVLLRYRIAPAHARDPSQPSLRDTVLEHVRAESAIRSLGGTLTIDTGQASETLIVVDLPAPVAT